MTHADPTTGDAPSKVQGAVLNLIRRIGEVPAAKRLGLSRQAILRIAAGLPVRRGTMALATMNLPVA